MKKYGFALAGALACLALSASAMGAVINVGSFNLLPNTPNQTIQISVTGGEAVQGLNFVAQIADGGPTVGGTVTGPAITSVSIIGPGTIFESNHQPPSLAAGYPEFPQYNESNVTTGSGTVVANGLLAIITIDTTGYAAGTFPLMLTDAAGGNTTDFAGIPISITNGSITIAAIPEPAAAGLIAPAALVLMRRRRA